MNQVYYGNLAYGIEAAAQTYFSKHASELNLPEAALLAGPAAGARRATTRSTSTEIAHRPPQPGAARDAQRGRHHARPVRLGGRKRPLGLKAGQALHDDPRAVLLQLRPRPADRRVRRGDRALAAGSRSTRRSTRASSAPPRRRSRRRSTTATTRPRRVISINPKNGAIRAMTAVTPGNTQEPVQPALAGARASPARPSRRSCSPRRSSRGSTRRRRPTSRRRSTTGRTRTGTARTARWWCPETYDHSYTGWTTIERATLRSDNTVYAQLTLDVDPGERSPDGAASSASARGSTSTAPTCPSIGLGAMDVSPLDMASAYATLAAGGIYSEPMAIRKVVLPDGEDTNAGWGKPKRKRVISDGVAVHGHADPRGEHPLRHRRRRRTTGSPRPGKTGTTEECVRRLVLRLHAAARHDRLGRLPEGRRSRWRACTGSRSPAAASRRRSGGSS